MSVYAISDLHLDFSKEKPMDVFGENWVSHEEKIFESWKSKVKEDDVVLICGDISWGLKLEEAHKDLLRIDNLPGKKIISKGNHDLWWQTKAKLKELELKSIHFLQNDNYQYENIAICGTRGWASKDSDEFSEHDEKIFSREVNRLDISLRTVEKGVDKKIVMIHYPPFNFKDSSPNEFVDVMKKYNTDICIYGHLHGEGHKFVVEGEIEDINFYCTSSDYLNFDLKKII